MKILSIDTSCDESCAAIIDLEQWRLLSNVVHSHIDPMKKFGGVVPEIASREHLRALPLVVSEALEQAEMKSTELDWISVTNRPGLIGALLVGVSFAKAFAFAHDKPFSVINHIEAHLFSALLATTEGESVPPFPWLALVVSGGHTELFLVRNELDYEWLGGTLDDAAGEAFDKIGKVLDLPYPAGPFMDRWVQENASPEDRKRFAFPRAKTKASSFSFSGLKTSVATQVKKLQPLTDSDRLAVAASAQEAIIDALVKKTKEASGLHGITNIVVTGGVACNSRLRERFPEAFFPKPRYCTDNAAMIALLTALYARNKKLEPAPWSTTAIPYLD